MSADLEAFRRGSLTDTAPRADVVKAMDGQILAKGVWKADFINNLLFAPGC
jgi:hypothetical protein